MRLLQCECGHLHASGLGQDPVVDLKLAGRVIRRQQRPPVMEPHGPRSPQFSELRDGDPEDTRAGWKEAERCGALSARLEQRLAL